MSKPLSLKRAIWVCNDCGRAQCTCEVPVYRLVAAVCSCGKPARTLCGVGVPGLTLTLCEEPVCGGEDRKPGSWCKQHRHRNGTMGYPFWNPVDTRYAGNSADAPGIWPAIKAKLQTLFKTATQIAQQARDEQGSQFAAPSPLPALTFRVGKRVFQSSGGRMVEVPNS